MEFVNFAFRSGWTFAGVTLWICIGAFVGFCFVEEIGRQLK